MRRVGLGIAAVGAIAVVLGSAAACAAHCRMESTVIAVPRGALALRSLAAWQCRIHPGMPCETACAKSQSKAKREPTLAPPQAAPLGTPQSSRVGRVSGNRSSTRQVIEVQVEVDQANVVQQRDAR